jgi:hypothetical protein
MSIVVLSRSCNKQVDQSFAAVSYRAIPNYSTCISKVSEFESACYAAFPIQLKRVSLQNIQQNVSFLMAA